MEAYNHELKVSQYIDNELEQEELNEFVNHLNDCDECRELLSDFQNYRDEIKNFYSSLKLNSKKPVINSKVTSSTNKRLTLLVAATIVAIVITLFNLIKIGELPQNNISDSVIKNTMDQRTWKSDVYSFEKKLNNLKSEIKSNPF